MQTVDVIFKKPFNAIPTIVCTLKSGSNITTYGDLTAFVDYGSVTKKGFTIKVSNSCATLGAKPCVSWIATVLWNSNKSQYVVIDLGTISLGELGYYRINDNEKYPIYAKIVEISYYSFITPISAINIYRGENGGTYVFGSPNTEIRDLQIRCWYW